MNLRLLAPAASALLLAGVGFLAVAAPQTAAADPPSCDVNPHPARCHTPSPSPSPTDTSPSPSPSPSPTPGMWDCVLVGDVDCGPYDYVGITNSNGYNTYTSTDCWGHPDCGYLLESNNPGDWQVTATEPLGNTAVMTYPDVQQLMNNWCGNGWGGCANPTDTPRSGLVSLTSSYTETMNENADTAAQAAWDLWTSSGELMIWVDEVGRGSGGAVACGYGTLSGYPFTYYVYGGNFCTGGLPIIKLNEDQRSATIDLLAALDYFTSVGQFSASGTIGQANFGWEVCSTGGVPETFQMTGYTLTGVPA